MATARLNIRISEQLKAKARKAAVLADYKNLADYVANVLDEYSTEVISQHESFTIGGDACDRFVDECNKVNKPNSALTNAAQFAEDRGFN
jgi:uncharacterized protein (DUF1778 family)